MSTPYLHVRPGHPDFLDLDWDAPINDWEGPRLVDLPTGVHRHPVRFLAYEEGLYAIKELPLRLALHEFEMLRTLATRVRNVVKAVAVAERRWLNPHTEGAGVVMTEYVQFAFSYRELITGGGFGARRNQMLDAFAGLLVELHLAGCFWGDCSLSNVLYRYDAATIEAVMIDGETVRLYDALTDGQRAEDIDIMILNVAGGMADIAASQGVDLDEADLSLGDDIAARYYGLWDELNDQIVVGPDERYRIRERVERLNDLGFEVDDFELVPTGDGGSLLQMQVAVGGRNYHASRLRELTRIEASENQARQILSDLQYYEATHPAKSATGKAVAAIQWRVEVFEPILARITEAMGPGDDPVQGYANFLHFRFALASSQGRDVPTQEAFELLAGVGPAGLSPRGRGLGRLAEIHRGGGPGDSTVDRQGDPGDPRRRVGDEEHDGPGDVLGFAEPLAAGGPGPSRPPSPAKARQRGGCAPPTAPHHSLAPPEPSRRRADG